MMQRSVTIGILARGWDPVLVRVLSACVKSTLDILVVIDADMSTGLSTWAETLETMGDNVRVCFNRTDSIAEQRNELHRLSRTPLVAHIDSDEVPDQALLSALEFLDASSGRRAWRVRLVDCIWAKPLRRGGLVYYKVRVLPSEMRWFGNVHEVPETPESISTLDGTLMHYTMQSIDQWMQKTRLYVVEDAKTRRWRHPLACLLVRPPAKMIRGLFWRRGILDGIEGVVAQYLAFVYETLLCLAVLEKKRSDVR